MVKHFNHNFGFVAEEIFEQGILENLDRCFDSFKKKLHSDSVVNSHRKISTKIEVRTLC